MASSAPSSTTAATTATAWAAPVQWGPTGSTAWCRALLHASGLAATLEHIAATLFADDVVAASTLAVGGGAAAVLRGVARSVQRVTIFAANDTIAAQVRKVLQDVAGAGAAQVDAKTGVVTRLPVDVVNAAALATALGVTIDGTASAPFQAVASPVTGAVTSSWDASKANRLNILTAATLTSLVAAADKSATAAAAPVDLLLPFDGAQLALARPLLPVWDHGVPTDGDASAADTAGKTPPAIQVFEYDADTFILRVGKHIHYEANFLLLLFGEDKVMLQDTGPIADAATMPVEPTVSALIQAWATKRGCKAPHLIVAHTHGHDDHMDGDAQFTSRPDTTIVDTTVEGVTQFYGFTAWPTQAPVSYDLGKRSLQVFAIPGHEDSHIATYDARTGLLLTGDTVYPGRLYVRNHSAFYDSVNRLAQFATTHVVSLVLGTHVEMTTTPGKDYKTGTKYQPEEHELALFPAHILEMQAALRQQIDEGSTEVLLERTVLDSLIVYPISSESDVHPSDDDDDDDASDEA